MTEYEFVDATAADFRAVLAAPRLVVVGVLLHYTVMPAAAWLLIRLLALDAEIELASVRGVRRVPYRDYCLGYRKTARAADELIIAAYIPIPAAGVRLCWRKVGTRRAQSISKIMASAYIVLDGDIVRDARVALGAVADRPIRIAAVEAAVRGVRMGAAGEAARAALAGAISPISDIRSNAGYRLDVAQNVVARFFS